MQIERRPAKRAESRLASRFLFELALQLELLALGSAKFLTLCHVLHRRVSFAASQPRRIAQETKLSRSSLHRGFARLIALGP